MSHLTKRVERDLKQIADRATPSPHADAWDAIQTRIAEQVDQPDREIVMLDADRPSRRSLRVLVGTAAAALLLAIGVIALTRSDEDSSLDITTGPPPEALDFEFQPIPVGRYRVETLGAPFVIDIPDRWGVELNDLGFFVLSPSGFSGPSGPAIAMMRPSNLADPSQPGAPNSQQADDWPLNDIDGWIDALVPGVVAGEPVDTTIGGLDAVRFDVTLSSEVECGDQFFGHEEPQYPGNVGCIGLATNRDVRGLDFYRNQNYRVWWIDGGDEAPIVVIASDGGRVSDNFIDQAEAVLDTMIFESIGPNPIPGEGNLWELGIPDVVPSGPVTLPVGPGVTFDMSEPHFIFPQNDFHTSALVHVDSQIVGQTDVFFPDQTFDGQTLATVADVVGSLERQTDLTITLVGTRTVNGFDATEIDIERRLVSGAGGSPVLGRADQSDRGWTPQRNGTLWILETPEGLVAIATGWSQPAGEEPARGLAVDILDSIVIGS